MATIEDLLIIRVQGRAIPLPGDNIDTDEITPAAALAEPDYSNAADYLFLNARKANPNHPLDDPQYKGANILIVGNNFGCGSSRETSPQAIKRFGIDVLVGESFAAIFQGNCTALGMPAVCASKGDMTKLMEYTKQNPGTIYTLDLDSKTLTYAGQAVAIDIAESTRTALTTGMWNAVAMLKANQPLVSEVAARLPYMNNFSG